jgi:putative aldouronate transport system permease protein
MGNESVTLPAETPQEETLKEIREKQRRSRIRQLDAQKALHFMIFPALFVTLIFAYLPMYGLIISFKNYNVFKGVLGSPWARINGFEHFLDFFTNPQVWQVLRNTLALAFFSLVIVQPLPMIFAMLLNEIRIRQLLSAESCS